MINLVRLLVFTALSGCAWVSDADLKDWDDHDRDGLSWEEDCDDDDPDVGEAPRWYVDEDGDGFGQTDNTVTSCGYPEGSAAVGGDCDDGASSVHPGAEETPYDDIDQDCSGADLSDADGDGQDAKQAGGEDCDDNDPTVYDGAGEVPYDGVDQDCADGDLEDQDQDGWPASEAGGEDCDDRDADVFPGADEAWYDGRDQDCDGQDDYDADGDGERAETWGEDCDDADADVHPGAEEVCSDGVDNDCDGVASCGLSGDLDLSGAAGVWTGANKGDRAGFAVATVGNFDLDAAGTDDLLVGARYLDDGATNVGGAYVLTGPITGSGSLADAAARFIGESVNDEAGFAVAGLGDVDSDDNPDLVIGAPRKTGRGTYSGAVYVVLGPVSGEIELAESTGPYIAGDESADLAGWAVAGAGDMDGDTAGDIAIGAPGKDSNAGMVYLVQDLPGGSFLITYSEGEWSGESNGDGAGTALDGAGDANADGYQDLVIGAPKQDTGGGSSGTAYLLYGPATGEGSLSDADTTLIGEHGGDEAGTAVVGAGDLNGDGYADVLVGAPYDDTAADGAGVAYLVHGPVGGAFNLYNADARLYGVSDGENAGAALSVGDLDTDGVLDVVVGAPMASATELSSRGLTYVMYGPLSGDLSLADADAAVAGTAADLYAGAAVRGSGDLDGDGVHDLAIGGWGYALDDADANAGAVWVFSGGGL